MASKKKTAEAAAAVAGAKVEKTDWRSPENGEFPQDSKDIVVDVEGVGEVPARYMSYLFYTQNSNGAWELIDGRVNRWKYADSDR